MMREELTLTAPSPTATGGAPTLFDGEPWRRSVEEAFDLVIRRFDSTVEPGGHGYYSELSDLRGDRIVATPFSDFCDPRLGPDGWRELADHLRSFEVPVTVRPFRNEAVVGDSSFERRQELLWHGVDLSDGYDAVWDGLKSKVRTALRRPAKAGITFRWSSSIEDLATFHAMHVDLRKSKYGLLAQPFSFFATLHDHFGDDMAVVLAEDDGAPVAAMVFFAWDGVWYYKFGASYPRSLRPNGALIMEACREGAARGLRLLDMGRSDIDQPGLVQFKQQFASEELALTTLHWEPMGYHHPAGARAGQVLGAVTELLTGADVPNEVSARGGEVLYRFFG